MKLFSDDWTGMLRKQLTGHINEKGRQIRLRKQAKMAD